MDLIEIKGKINTAICYARVVEDEAIEQIRRMCDYIGYPVRQLKRYKIANLTLNGLNRGQYRPLYEEELQALLKAVDAHE